MSAGSGKKQSRKKNTNRCARGFNHIWEKDLLLSDGIKTHDIYECLICESRWWKTKPWNDQDRKKVAMDANRKTKKQIIEAEEREER